MSDVRGTASGSVAKQSPIWAMLPLRTFFKLLEFVVSPSAVRDDASAPDAISTSPCYSWLRTQCTVALGSAWAALDLQ